MLEMAIFIATSLGGLVTMVLSIMAADRIAGVLLNDVGPELDTAGIDRIKTYVGKPALFADWADAAEKLHDRLGDVSPRYSRDDWETFARRCCRETERGVEFDYDMAIAEPFKAANSDEPVDAWPFYRALAGRPVLILRGANSDLLTDSALRRMASEIPDVEIVTVPNVGHAPDLSEPESVAAIDRLLERVLKR